MVTVCCPKRFERGGLLVQQKKRRMVVRSSRMQQSGLQGRVTARGVEWRAAGAHVRTVPAAVTGTGKGRRMDDSAGQERTRGRRERG